ncbi:glycosyltransferase [Microbacterium sp. NPDC076895]|uniref:glycosyltransferase n=1 Tax=Microbacterium sp. NPDC076895 TaxID=3154957 RepID=UPI0034416DA0
MRPLASVVIPAHNEASVIERCLTTMLADALPGEFAVIVVVNGSTDATADVGRRAAPDAIVEEISTASKIAALRHGDEIAETFPRVYLDADVDIDTAGLRALVAALDVQGARAASARMIVDTSASNGWVRAYFRVWEMTDYRRNAMIGSGVYAVNREGHRRIADWPMLIADDLFVQESFARTERTVVGADFSVRAPRTLRDQVRRMTRWRRGNTEFGAFRAANPGRFPETAEASGSSVRGLIGRVARTPARWADFTVYVGVYVAAGIAARMDARKGRDTWRRDESTRDRSQER